MGTKRKYMALGKKLAGDKFTFSDAEFSVSPVRGAIMPHGTQEITVQFQPKGPNEKSKVAYCEISGKSTRQPIVFKGTGIGPKAVFSYDVLELGQGIGSSYEGGGTKFSNFYSILLIFTLVFFVF